MPGNATTITYNHNANFHGADSFDYTLSDGTDIDRGYPYGAKAVDLGIPQACDCLSVPRRLRHAGDSLHHP